MFSRSFARAFGDVRATHVIAGASVLGATLLAMQKKQQASCSAGALHSPEMPWSHKGWLNSFDTARCGASQKCDDGLLSLIFQQQ